MQIFPQLWRHQCPEGSLLNSKNLNFTWKVPFLIILVTKKKRKGYYLTWTCFWKNYAYEKSTISDRKRHFLTRLKIYEILGGKFEPQDIFVQDILKDTFNQKYCFIHRNRTGAYFSTSPNRPCTTKPNSCSL